MMWDGEWGRVGWAWFGLMHAFWWLLVIAGIIALVRWLMDSGRNERRADEGKAMDILRERFARGEIGREEYEERKRVLKG